MERKYGKLIQMEKLGRTITWRKSASKKMNEAAKSSTVIGNRSKCPICGETKSSTYVNIYGFTYLQCINCDHLYHEQIIAPNEIQDIYDGDSTYLEYIIDENVFQYRINAIADPKVSFVTKAIAKNSGEWLDIGCGGCELLYAAKKHGWQVRGIEAGLLGVSQGDKLGIPVKRAFVTEENAADLLGKPYVISIINVLEHLPDPLHVFSTIVANAVSTKYFVVELPRHPSLSAFAATLYPENTARQLIVPDHIHIFSEKSVALLLEKSGLHCSAIWTFGQDFYEIMSMLTQQAGKDIDCWPKELFSSVNDVQAVLDKHGLSDTMLIIAERDC